MVALKDHPLRYRLPRAKKRKAGKVMNGKGALAGYEEGKESNDGGEKYKESEEGYDSGSECYECGNKMAMADLCDSEKGRSSSGTVAGNDMEIEKQGNSMAKDKRGVKRKR